MKNFALGFRIVVYSVFGIYLGHLGYKLSSSEYWILLLFLILADLCGHFDAWEDNNEK